ncbi:hypothetical protein EJ110_NYTH39047 [Nymphaea thermarum]|nr:hypothetical protein EJ110_NYTH39047 [Nymphaea thermarum]
MHLWHVDIYSLGSTSSFAKFPVHRNNKPDGDSKRAENIIHVIVIANMDVKVKAMVKLIEEDVDSFARRA